jgi:hypothetical protein
MDSDIIARTALDTWKKVKENYSETKNEKWSVTRRRNSMSKYTRTSWKMEPETGV